MAMAIQVSCHYVSCKNSDDVLQTPTFEVKNKLGEVFEATYKYPSNVAMVAFNNVIVVMLEGAHEHVGIVGEHNPQIVQVTLVMC